MTPPTARSASAAAWGDTIWVNSQPNTRMASTTLPAETSQ